MSRALKEKEVSQVKRECGIGRTFQTKLKASDITVDGTGRKGLGLSSGQSERHLQAYFNDVNFMHKAFDATGEFKLASGIINSFDCSANTNR